MTLPPDSTPILGHVLAHWREIHPAPGLLPGRRHFDPAALAARCPDALPHLWLMEVEEAPRRYRLRLIGTMLTASGSPGRPGRYLDEVDKAGETTALFDRICAERIPHYRRGPPRLPQRDGVREVEVLTLPLAADGRQVDMLLICTVYHFNEGQEPQSMVLG